MLEFVKQELSRRRTLAQNQAVYNNAYANSLPEFVKINTMLKPLYRELAKIENTANHSAKVTQLQSQISELENNQIIFLESNNLHLTPAYTCLKCNDTGYQNGKICECVNEIIRKFIETNSLLCPYNVTLDSIDSIISKDNEKDSSPLFPKYVHNLKFYIEKFDVTTKCNHILTGSTGTGKTLLASAVYNSLTKLNYSCLWVSASSLNRLFFETFKHLELLDEIRRCDFLVIDDLGVEPQYRGITIENLLSLLNDRMQLNRKTMFTTNLSPDELHSRYGMRITSRLFDKSKSVTLQISGLDRRINI